MSDIRERIAGALESAKRLRTDVFSPFPADADTGDGTRRESRTLRFFVIGFLISMSLNVMQMSMLKALFPLVRLQPMIIRTDSKQDQIVKVEPFDQKTPGFELQTQVLARQYVEIRHSIVLDGPVMAARFGPNGFMAHFSSPQMFEAFTNEMREILKEADRRKISRSVRILADPIKVDERFYQIEFETTDVEKGVPTSQQWVASIIVDYVPQNVRYEERYMNPLGFTVTGYSVVKKI